MVKTDSMIRLYHSPDIFWSVDPTVSKGFRHNRLIMVLCWHSGYVSIIKALSNDTQPEAHNLPRISLKAPRLDFHPPAKQPASITRVLVRGIKRASSLICEIGYRKLSPYCSAI
jgi:hypothetical protein